MDNKITVNENEDESVVGRNALVIDGVITIPDGVDQDKFFDEFIYWLESKNSSFFGFTRPVEDEEDGNGCVEKILTERAGIDLKEKE